jgi:predicted DNA-binding WGR domain protein
MMAVYMERCDPIRNLARFYQVDVQPTLFGDWAVISSWGRIGTYGRSQQDRFSSLPEARMAQEQKIARKKGADTSNKTTDGVELFVWYS